MNDGDRTDVDRALAAIGATPIKYRNFGNHKLRPTAAYVATAALLDDAAYDPFAPQAAVHSMDEAQPDVLLPADLPTSDLPTVPPPAGPSLRLIKAEPPCPPGVDPIPQDVPALAAPAPKPVCVAVETTLHHPARAERADVVAAPAPLVVKAAPPMPDLARVVTPVIARRFVARAAAIPSAISAQSTASSFPSLGTRMAAQEAIHAEISKPGPGSLSISEMFRTLNARSVPGPS